MFLPDEQRGVFEKAKKVNRINHYVSVFPKVFVYGLFALIALDIVVMMVLSIVNPMAIESMEDSFNSLLKETGDEVIFFAFAVVFVLPVAAYFLLRLLVYLYARFGVGVRKEDELALAEYATEYALSPILVSDAELNRGFTGSMEKEIIGNFVDTRPQVKGKHGVTVIKIDNFARRLGECKGKSGYIHISHTGKNQYCNIYRSFMERVSVYKDSDGHTKRTVSYENWYFCELEESVPSRVTIGTKGFIAKKDTRLLSIEGCAKKFRVKGSESATQPFLTDNKLEYLSSFAKTVKKDFCIEIFGNRALFIERCGNDTDIFTVRHNDTEESYIARIQSEVDKMKSIVEYLNR